MKTATLSTTVGHNNAGSCVYILPPLNESLKQLNGFREEADNRERMKEEDQHHVHLVSPHHEEIKEKSGSLTNKHFITQANIPSGREISGGEPFSYKMVMERFSETVAVPVLPPSGPRHSCASFCNYESEQRYKESMDLEPTMAASKFKVSMVCYQDCTKKRHRTTLLFGPRLRPTHFGETNFVQPKRKETRFVSYVDVGGDTKRRWHTTSVVVRPRTACNSFVRGFQFYDGDGSWDDTVNSLDDLESIGSSGFLDDECGSFPGHSDMELHLNDGEISREGYRAHMVVGGK